MSESPEVESNYSNPQGKSNLEKGEEPPVQNTDQVQTANQTNSRIKKASDPKLPPSGNLEYAGQSDNTPSK